MYTAVAWLFCLLFVSSIRAQTWYSHSSVEYYVSNSAHTFQDGSRQCSDQGASIAEIKTMDVQLFLHTLMEDFASGKNNLRRGGGKEG